LSPFLEPICTRSRHTYLILDSGAYSTFFSGKSISLEGYTEFVEAVAQDTLGLVNLDTIPGARGQRATQHETEDAAIRSFETWKRLKRTGANIVPVYHQTERIEWLWRYLDAGAYFVGISPSDLMPSSARRNWLIEVHHLLEREGVGLNRDTFTHILGAFSPNLLGALHGRAWSADATTLLAHSMRYRLYLPFAEGRLSHRGKFDSLKTLYVGDRSWYLATGNAAGAQDIAHYLDEVGCSDSYRITGGRLVADIYAVSRANLHTARRMQEQTRTRAFIAGTDEKFVYQALVMDQWPYYLASYAAVKDSEAVRDFKTRNLRRPG
jgi:hypothetical protein